MFVVQILLWSKMARCVWCKCALYTPDTRGGNGSRQCHCLRKLYANLIEKYMV